MLFLVNGKIKPVLKWAGGKSGPLPQLIQHFPEAFERFIEPFVGSGAVFFALKKMVPGIINDSNPELIGLYEVIRDSPEKLMKELDGLARDYSEKFYYLLRNERPHNEIRRAARMLFLNKTGFNGLYRLNSKGEFNVPFGKRQKCPALYKRDNLLAVSCRLKGVQILNLDFEKIIDRSGTGDFVYCDPPYEPLSQTSSFTSYTAFGFARSEQARLKKVCERAVGRGAVVAVSNSAAPFILNLYSTWVVHIISARRAINSKAGLRGKISETLAMLSPSALGTSYRAGPSTNSMLSRRLMPTIK